MRRAAVVLALALAATAILSGQVVAGPTRDAPASRDRVPQVQEAGAHPASAPGRLTPTQRAGMAGTLPRDAAQLAALKARAMGRSSASPASWWAPAAPTIERTWQGIRDDTGTPPDTTGAIGTTRYIELVNRKFAIYDRINDAPLSTGTLTQLFGAGAFDNVFDPQVIWDGQTERFYYVGDNVVSASDNRLSVGFSKTASPNSHADFCKYEVTYGSEFPDYPKLGDSQHFWLIGSNVFGPQSFIRSDVFWISKPPAGTACPGAATFNTGTFLDIKNQNGTQAFTPVPVNQTDTNGTGWVLSNDSYGDPDHINLHRVTRNRMSGDAVLGNTDTVAVPGFAIPPPAPQKGTVVNLDTLDARHTQAVSAIDPSRGASGKLAIWTQHAVGGGAGTETRWYEIDPPAATLFQSGAARHQSLHVYNGAISPDRLVRGNQRAFGESMVMGFSTSSANQFTRIQMVSKIGAAAQSGFVLVKASNGRNIDFSCSPSVACRWGDYAGATPDPGAAVGAEHGRVWLSNQWNVRSRNDTDVDWRTWNWSAAP